MSSIWTGPPVGAEVFVKFVSHRIQRQPARSGLPDGTPRMLVFARSGSPVPEAPALCGCDWAPSICVVTGLALTTTFGPNAVTIGAIDARSYHFDRARVPPATMPGQKKRAVPAMALYV